jgi:hypothetical protein
LVKEMISQTDVPRETSPLIVKRENVSADASLPESGEESGSGLLLPLSASDGTHMGSNFAAAKV